MTRKSKILLGFFGFFLSSILLCFYWYFRTENYYGTHLGLRIIELDGKIKILRQNNYCGQTENKPECFKAFMAANEDIKFNSDLRKYTVAIFTVCGEQNLPCIFESTNKLILAIDVNKLWLLENIKTPDTDYKRLLKEELGLMNKFLRTYRKKLSDQYSVESDPSKKVNLMDFVKQVDSKILTLQSTNID